MKPTKAVIVCGNTEIECDIKNLVATADLMDVKVVGFKKSYNVRVCDEIQDQPIFDKLVGPFYGGEGIVRYEDQRTYEALST